MISWEKAIYLLMQGKADAIENYNKKIRSVTQEFVLPKVLRLKRYFRSRRKVRTTYRKVSVFYRDNFICQFCGIKVTRSTATIDHVIPRSKGGLSTYENTVTACNRCNSRKRDRTPNEAGMKLLRVPKAPKENPNSVCNEAESMYQKFIEVFPRKGANSGSFSSYLLTIASEAYVPRVLTTW